MIRFANWWFLLLIPIVIYLFWAVRKKKAIRFSSIKLLRQSGSKKNLKTKIGKALILSGLILALIALARPQSTEEVDNIQKQGIDIAMLLDVSGSMQSVDFEPNRLEVARQTIDNFVKERVNDRLSLIIFAGTAFTRIPLTLDHNIVRDSLEKVTTESVNQDGTAIGMAISVGLNRLKKSKASSRIMILVTDGDNNAGAIDPLTATNLAREAGIRIYTVGVGSDTLIMPVQVFGQTQYNRYPGGFDEDLLKQIADITGGQYFRAMDPKALSQIFETINRLERSDFEDKNYREYNELAFPLIMLALALLLIGIVLDKYYFVQIP
ncbi:MAG: VWA domain-containing protein [Clostridiales bacterium]|jgi:Ca-activated chloride channel family protein|nr:VWA domain-containing protein [Clostridiales bacterium]MDR2712453.1 VWA domain-containing protein [Clostridiales bacterium]